jgi:hypothetical protein
MIAPANASELNDVFAQLLVPVLRFGSSWFNIPMYWALQNLRESEHKQYKLHFSSIFSAATVLPTAGVLYVT